MAELPHDQKPLKKERIPLATIPDGHADRCVGVLLGCMAGDILGSPVEGYPRTQLQGRKPKTEGGDWKIREFEAGPVMGLREIRYGMYTDDTQSTLALADALVSGQFNALNIARNYAAFYKHKPIRGYPGTAQAVLRAVESSDEAYKTSGRLCFKDGSFANGGAMRIAPMGVAWRNASSEVFREAVRLAIVSSHVHPESIDGAVIIAYAVATLCRMRPSEWEPLAFLKKMEATSTTPELKKRIGYLIYHMQRVLKKEEVSDDEVLREICDEWEFQIRTRDAVPCALWAMARYGSDPKNVIIEAVNLGGDADTVGAMAGAMAGALYGAKWLPQSWDENLENDTEWGRDYALGLGLRLAALDLTQVPDIPQNKV